MQVVTSSALLGSAAANYAQAIQTFPKNATSLSVNPNSECKTLHNTLDLHRTLLGFPKNASLLYAHQIYRKLMHVRKLDNNR